jgi:hypothetical protein
MGDSVESESGTIDRSLASYALKNLVYRRDAAPCCHLCYQHSWRRHIPRQSGAKVARRKYVLQNRVKFGVIATTQCSVDFSFPHE